MKTEHKRRSHARHNPGDWPDFLSPVEIIDAIAALSAIKLMDMGTLIRVSGLALNATTVLYTVPSGKAFYLLSYYHCFMEYAALTHYTNLEIYDGTTIYHITRVQAPSGVTFGSEAASFTMLKIPEGWKLQLYADESTIANAACIGVEIGA